MMGNKDINTDRRTDGRRPVMTPRMTLGMSRIHFSHVKVSVR